MKRLHLIFKASFLLIWVLALASCTKEVPKDMMSKDKKSNEQTQEQDKQKMPDDDIHKNIKQDGASQTDESITKGDPKAEELSKAADDADTEYQKTNSDADKKLCVQKQLAAANYLMFEANLSPKKKYRPALQRYRRVLELDPGNKEAAKNKKEIEDIYTSMGMPIPD
jgi:hypothetical protein